MKHFVVYDQQGNILRTGTCPASMVHLQAGAGENVMEGKADDRTQRVQIGTGNPQIVNREETDGTQ